jgi:hypothetical protein
MFQTRVEAGEVRVSSYLNDGAETSGFEWLTYGDVAVERHENRHPDCCRLSDESQRK